MRERERGTGKEGMGGRGGKGRGGEKRAKTAQTDHVIGKCSSPTSSMLL